MRPLSPHLRGQPLSEMPLRHPRCAGDWQEGKIVCSRRWERIDVTFRDGNRSLLFLGRHLRLAKAGSPATARGCGELWRALLAAAVAVSSFRLDFDRKGQGEAKRARMKRIGTLPLPTIKIWLKTKKLRAILCGARGRTRTGTPLRDNGF